MTADKTRVEVDAQVLTLKAPSVLFIHFDLRSFTAFVYILIDLYRCLKITSSVTCQQWPFNTAVTNTAVKMY